MQSAGSPIPLARIYSPNFLTEDRPLQSPQDDNDLFPHSRTLEQSELDAIHPTWKRDLHALLEHPKSSSPAFFLHAFLTFLIVSSALVTVLETVPDFHSINGRIWFGMETSLVALFTMEYIARCLAWSNTWSSLAKWLFCERFLTLRFVGSKRRRGSTNVKHFSVSSISLPSFHTI
jgi:potassium voltage-gated channel Shal-related subfamily D protein 2